jgi:uncharacterized membrane protein
MAIKARLHPRTDAAVAVRRYWEIDALRGVAIVMMVLYHLLYDLQHFGGYDIRVRSGFWNSFADATAFLFVFLVGVSLSVSYGRARGRHTNGHFWGFPKYLRRGAKIFGYGLLITVVTWFIDPQLYIRFGILHLIGLSIILAYPLLRYRALNAALGLGLIAAGIYLQQQHNAFGYPWLFWVGFIPHELNVFDYRPLLPWFGVVLLGIAVGNWLYPESRRAVVIPDLSRVAGIDLLAVLGRNSLTIYLVHQPLLVASLFLLGIAEL